MIHRSTIPALDTTSTGRDDADFPPLDSIPNRPLSIASATGAASIVVFWAMFLLASIWLLLFRHEEPLALRIFLVAITTGAPVVLVMFFRSDSPLYDAIRVDRTGLVFFDKGKQVRKIRWSDLRKNPGVGYDISVETVGGHIGTLNIQAKHETLRIWVKSGNSVRHERLYFRGTRTFHSVFSNAGELRSHFLLGLKAFRRGLSIDPAVSTTFYIDKVSGLYDRRSRYMTNTGAIGLAIVIALAIFAYAHRTAA